MPLVSCTQLLSAASQPLRMRRVAARLGRQHLRPPVQAGVPPDAAAGRGSGQLRSGPVLPASRLLADCCRADRLPAVSQHSAGPHLQHDVHRAARPLAARGAAAGCGGVRAGAGHHRSGPIFSKSFRVPGAEASCTAGEGLGKLLSAHPKLLLYTKTADGKSLELGQARAAASVSTSNGTGLGHVSYWRDGAAFVSSPVAPWSPHRG